jgi:hypothetical protein
MSIMSRVYERASYCFVFPGGLGGLVKFDEHTTWIHRSWTLMEALSPEEVWCIFKWTRGSGGWRGITSVSAHERVVTEIMGGDQGCAMTRLEDALAVSTGGGEDASGGGAHFVSDSGRILWDQEYRLFSENIQPMIALSAAMAAQREVNKTRAVARAKWRRVTRKEQWQINGAETAIWRCALMRISQYDQDIVYSTMGLFGVNLEYRKERGKDELMVELCTKILERGGRANWFGASVLSPVPQYFCTMPPTAVPDTRELQKTPLVKIPDDDPVQVQEVMGFLMWFLEEAPTGEVTKGGAVKFRAPISRVKISGVKSKPLNLDEVNPIPGFKSIAWLEFDGRNTLERREASFAGTVGTHAICLGRCMPYPHYDDLEKVKSYQGKNDFYLILMLLEERVGGGWQKTGMAAIASPMPRWRQEEIEVGGVAD